MEHVLCACEHPFSQANKPSEGEWARKGVIRRLTGVRQSFYSPFQQGFLSKQSDELLCVWKRSPFHAELLECYCHNCGLLIGASPKSSVLRLLSRIHVCPVYFNYSRPAA